MGKTEEQKGKKKDKSPEQSCGELSLLTLLLLLLFFDGNPQKGKKATKVESAERSPYAFSCSKVLGRVDKMASSFLFVSLGLKKKKKK